MLIVACVCERDKREKAKGSKKKKRERIKIERGNTLAAQRIGLVLSSHRLTGGGIGFASRPAGKVSKVTLDLLRGHMALSSL